MASNIIGKIAVIVATLGANELYDNLKEAYGNREFKGSGTKTEIFKEIKEPVKERLYGLVYQYSDEISKFRELVSGDSLVAMFKGGAPLFGLLPSPTGNAHSIWEMLVGETFFTANLSGKRERGTEPEAIMFLRCHIHILMNSVGFITEEIEEIVDEKYSEFLQLDKSYHYGKIWNVVCGYGTPSRIQVFDSHGGTLWSAAYYKYFAGVRDKYKELSELYLKEGKIEKLQTEYSDEYWVATVFSKFRKHQTF